MKFEKEIQEITGRMQKNVLTEDSIYAALVLHTDIRELFRSWAEHILIELRHIRANAPLTVGDKGKTRGRLDELIKKIEMEAK